MLYDVSEFPSFLRLSTIPLYCIPHFVYVFIHWWPLGCFHLLTVANNSAMHMSVQIPLRVPVFSYSGYIPRSGGSGWYGYFIFNFLDELPMMFNYSHTILHSHPQCTRVPVPPRPSQACSLFAHLFCSRHPNRYKDWICISRMISDHFFTEMSVQVLCSFFNWLFVFIVVKLWDFLHIQDTSRLFRQVICKYFLPFHGLPFHSADCALIHTSF